MNIDIQTLTSQFMQGAMQKDMSRSLQKGDVLELGRGATEGPGSGEEIETVFNLTMHFINEKPVKSLLKFMMAGNMAHLMPDLFDVPKSASALDNNSLRCGEKVKVLSSNITPIMDDDIGEDTDPVILENIFHGVTAERISDGKIFKLPASVLISPKGVRLNGLSNEESVEVFMSRALAAKQEAVATVTDTIH